MASTAAPKIPPRPAKAQNTQATAAPANGSNGQPKVPPRPARRLDRSSSPNRESFARSPLNDVPGSHSMYAIPNASGSNLDVPRRPPSVSLPSIGQEGSEYADIESADEGSSSLSPTQTRNIAGDLQLHAPKPSLPSASARNQVATVTRTDSNFAAAAGIGKSDTPSQMENKHSNGSSLRSKPSFSRPDSSASTERRRSVLGEEPGMDFGQKVPMYPNAGGVQAPTPAPSAQELSAGPHDGASRSGRHHTRTRSGREVFSVPPGSYGLHGHGMPSKDTFEKAWYEKHPDAFQREEKGFYGPGLGQGKAEWAMSSEDLNKIVRNTASRGTGFGESC